MKKRKASAPGQFFKAELLKRTQRAILLQFASHDVWFPKSHATISNGDTRAWASNWILKQKGIQIDSLGRARFQDGDHVRAAGSAAD